MRRLLLITTLVLSATHLIAQISTSENGAIVTANGFITVKEIPPIWPGCERQTLQEKKILF